MREASRDTMRGGMGEGGWGWEGMVGFRVRGLSPEPSACHYNTHL